MNLNILIFKEIGLLPELFLGITIMYLLIHGIFLSINKNYPLIQNSVLYLSILILIMTCFLLFNDSIYYLEFTIFNNTIIIDYLSFVSKSIIGILSIFCILIMKQYLIDQKINNFEYIIIILFSILGIFILCSANDLLTAYLAIELQSLAFYVLASFKKNSIYSVEAGLKYFILGSFSSSLFLFGSSIIYGITGSTNFEDFKDLFFWILPGSMVSLVDYDKVIYKQNVDICMNSILNRLKNFHTRFLKLEDLNFLFFKFNFIDEFLVDENHRNFYREYVDSINRNYIDEKRILVSQEIFTKNENECSTCQPVKGTKTEYKEKQFNKKVENLIFLLKLRFENLFADKIFMPEPSNSFDSETINKIKNYKNFLLQYYEKIYEKKEKEIEFFNFIKKTVTNKNCIPKTAAKEHDIPLKDLDIFVKNLELAKILDPEECNYINDSLIKILNYLKNSRVVKTPDISLEYINLFLKHLNEIKRIDFEKCKSINDSMIDYFNGLKNSKVVKTSDISLESINLHLKRLNEIKRIDPEECSYITDSLIKTFNNLKNLKIGKTPDISLESINLFLKHLNEIKRIDFEKCKSINDSLINYFNGLKNSRVVNTSDISLEFINLFLKRLNEIKRIDFEECSYIIDSLINYFNDLKNSKVVKTPDISLESINLHLKYLNEIKIIDPEECSYITDSLIKIFNNLKNSRVVKTPDISLESVNLFLKYLNKIKRIDFEECNSINDSLINYFNGLKNSRVVKTPDRLLESFEVYFKYLDEIEKKETELINFIYKSPNNYLSDSIKEKIAKTYNIELKNVNKFIITSKNIEYLIFSNDYQICSNIYKSLDKLKLHIWMDDFQDINYFNKPFNLELLQVALIFILISLFFKLALVPFHLWAPDIYENSPSSSTFFFTVIPKLSIFILLLRFFYYGFYGFLDNFRYFIILIAILSIIVGSFTGIEQRKIKSLLAYSTISHMGYILIAFSTATFEGFQILISYIIVYMISGLCIWSVFMLTRLKNNYLNKQNKDLTDLILLQKSNKMLAIFFSVALLSMAGLPPMVGFFVKLNVFLAAIEVSLYYVGIISILCSIISTFFYIRIIKIIYFEKTLVGKLYYPITSIKSIIPVLFFYFFIFLFINPTMLYLISYKISILFF